VIRHLADTLQSLEPTQVRRAVVSAAAHLAEVRSHARLSSAAAPRKRSCGVLDPRLLRRLSSSLKRVTFETATICQWSPYSGQGPGTKSHSEEARTRPLSSTQRAIRVGASEDVTSIADRLRVMLIVISTRDVIVEKARWITTLCSASLKMQTKT
jgi:hypothetical protein